MIQERDRRRGDFLTGPAISLADGQSWIFPGASTAGEASHSAQADDPDRRFGRGYAALLGVLLDAQDEAEQARAELALGIALISRNYSLGPDDLQGLFLTGRGHSTSAALRTALHELAVGHLRAFTGTAPLPRPAAGPSRPGYRAPSLLLRGIGPVAAGPVGR